MDVEVTDTSIQQNPEQMDEEFTTTAYPNVQENLKLPTEDQVRLKEPTNSAGTLSSLQNLDREFSFTNQFLKEKSQEDEPKKTNIKSEVQSMVTIPIHQDTSFVPLMTTPVIDLTVSQLVSTTVQAPLPTSTTTVTAITTTTSYFVELILMNILLPKGTSNIFNLWIRNLVIRQRVEDFQLGIKSYQTQLNLTKPRWDATGFEFKHDFIVIDSPRAVTFRDKYGVQIIMCFNEIPKFNDDTLQQIDKALDYLVKEFKWLSNSLVHSLRALSTLRRSGLRMTSTTMKPCQEDSSEFYLITGRISMTYNTASATLMLAIMIQKSVSMPVQRSQHHLEATLPQG
ncbi:hypothetical protein Tco_0213153 [Tanacetum coccineum]